MNHLDLFSGIGGFALAASWVWDKEHNIVSFVEIDSFCQKILKKHWPDVPIHDDIRTLDYEKILAYAKRFNDDSRRYGIGENRREQQGKTELSKSKNVGKIGRDGKYRNRNTKQHDRQRHTYQYETQTKIHLLTGGFPCQPYSVAGKRRGKKDDRALWSQMFRIISECRPNWIIGENVDGIYSMEFEETIFDLESEGYFVEVFSIPACAVEANHQRKRFFITAHSNSSGLQRQIQTDVKTQKLHKKTSNMFNPFDAIAWNDPKRNCGKLRIGNGIPNWSYRIKSLGNAIVPQVVVPIMQAIKEVDRLNERNENP